MDAYFRNFCFPDENILYHYCSMDAFIKIVESKKLRFGNVIQMNDPTELSLRSVNWIELINKHYEEKPFKFEFLYDDKKIDFRQYLDLMSYHQDTLKTDSFFAFCMSTLFDDLNQWRVYGDNGSGVCLGFAISDICNLIEKDTNFTYVELEYEDLKRISELAAEHILYRIEDTYRVDDKKGLYRLLKNFYSELEFFVLRYKHPAYQAESEARLIYKKHNIQIDNFTIPKMDDIIVCRDCLNIKTYKEIALSAMMIKKIIFGPLNKTPIENVLLFLQANGVFLEPNQIYYSNIPYRKI